MDEKFDIIECLKSFSSVTLSQINEASLQNRFELKYLFPKNLLPSLFESLKEHYSVLEINNIRCFRYDTCYYDTPDFQLYRDHHNGYQGRIKVRQRCYVDSNQIYFEIKNKTSEIRTNKIRVPIDKMNGILDEEQLKLIYTNRFERNELKVVLNNNFRRVTLCDRNVTERITIDIGIEFQDENRCNSVKLENVVLMEIKLQKTSNRSIAILEMKKRYVFETSFSKYAVGVAYLNPGIKQNNLKPIILKLNKYAN